MTSSPIRLLIADDHPVVREGIIGMFAGQEHFQIVGQAANGEKAVEMAMQLQPDVILMDLRMPVLDGLGAMERIFRAHPAARILVLTSHDSDQDIQAALRVGAIGYLLKDSPREALYEAVINAMQGKSTLSADVYRQMASQLRSPDDALTEREIEVLALAAGGNTNKAIGQYLHISEATVKTHFKHIFAKLDVPDRAAAVAAAIKRNIIRIP